MEKRRVGQSAGREGGTVLSTSTRKKGAKYIMRSDRFDEGEAV